MTDGVEFLGFRIFPGYRRLKRASVRRFIERMKRMQRSYNLYLVDTERIKRSIISWNAHAEYRNTYCLRESIISDLSFKRGNINKSYWEVLCIKKN